MDGRRCERIDVIHDVEVIERIDVIHDVEVIERIDLNGYIPTS